MRVYMWVCKGQNVVVRETTCRSWSFLQPCESLGQATGLAASITFPHWAILPAHQLKILLSASCVQILWTELVCPWIQSGRMLLRLFPCAHWAVAILLYPIPGPEQSASPCQPRKLLWCLEKKTFQVCAENAAPVYQLVCQNALILET